MATQAIEQPATDAAEATPAKKGGRSVLILAISGLVAGAAAGLFGVGPIFAKRKAETHAEPKVEAASATVNHGIDNLVLNPAGSGGTRFLMVTATFELKNAGADEAMKEHEPEIRDRVLALLAKKTVEDLTDPGMREAIKQEVLDAVAPILPKGSILKVFFPQFVVQ